VGATAADTQREIEEIRKDVRSAVLELRKRARRTTNVKRQARHVKENPAALGGVGLVVAGAVAVGAARAVAEARRRRRPEERLKRTVRSAAEELGERWERAREALPFDVRLSADDDDRGQSVQVERSNPNMVKRMLWAALVATVMAGAGLAARRVSAAVWRAAMNEEPPTANV
jgi:hypothetical protein